MATCDTSQATVSDEEDVDYESVKDIEKICSCGNCSDIWSTPWPGSEESFQHICCQQTDRWKEIVSVEEAGGCIVNSEPFKQATNMFVVRNMLMQLHGRGRIRITDPPQNVQMRYGFFRSALLFIGKLVAK